MADDPKLRVISMDVVNGEPDGIVWAEAPDKTISRLHIAELVCSYLDDLQDGEEVEIRFARGDLTRQAFDALPET